MTAVKATMAGRARVSLLTVLKVVANPLKLAYNGTEFSLIFGKFNWSLTSVTLESSTKLAICDVTADLSLKNRKYGRYENKLYKERNDLSFL
jgi:hypothetical protein